MFQFLQLTWRNFEAEVASFLPGAKTKVVSALGAVGSIALTGQQYVTGIPANRYVSPENIAIASFILFTLAFWLRDIGDRVDQRAILEAPKAIEP